MNDDEKKSAAEVITTTALALVSLGTGVDLAPIVDLARRAIGIDTERRLQTYLLAATASVTEKDTAAAIIAFATSDDDAMATMRRMLADDERQKAWLYGSLLQAFALGQCRRGAERLVLLRFVAAITAEDAEAAAAAANGIERIENRVDRIRAWLRALQQRGPLMRALEGQALCSIDNRDGAPSPPIHEHGRVERLMRILVAADRSRLASK